MIQGFKKNSRLIYVFFTFILTILNPFIMILFLLISYGIKGVWSKTSDFKIISLFISIFFGLLAFTQKSTWTGGQTDIYTYYQEYEIFTTLDFSNHSLLLLLFFRFILNYTFSILNILIILLFKNVQVISFLWTFIIYYFTFLSIYNYLKYSNQINILRNCKDRIKIVVFIILCAILFTKITDTIKSAAAITFFFYILSLLPFKISKLRIAFLLFLCIGIHSQTILLFPLLGYRKYKYIVLVYTSLLVMIVSPLINPLQLISNFLSVSNSWFGMLSDRALGYMDETGDDTSKRYIFIILILFVTCLYLYKRKKFTEKTKIANLILTYFIITYCFFNISTAFMRFVNFSSVLLSIEFVECLKFRSKSLSSIFFSLFFILTLQYNFGRLNGHGYTSSYMDNSIYELITSNIYDYLTYKAYNA